MRDTGPERRLVEQRGGQDVQRVEPAAGLADVLDDEVTGEVGIRTGRAVEPIAVLERVVHLRIRHRSRVEPHIEDVLDPAHRRSAGRVVRIRAGQLVDERAVQVVRPHPEVSLEFVQTAVDVDPRIRGIVGLPHRNRRAPVAIPGDRPVPRAGQPFAELAVLDVLGVPGDLLVQLHHAVTDLGDLDEPRRHRPVDQRIAAAPAVRVGVLVGVVAQQHRAVGLRRPGSAFEVPDDLRVGVEHVLPGVVGHGGVEPALGVDGRDGGDTGGLRGGHVVFAVGRGQMHQAGAVLGADEVGGQHLKRVGRVHEVRERRHVVGADQLGPGECGEHRRLLAELAGIGPHPGLGEHVAATVLLDHDVGDLGIDRHALIRRQRPWRRRPHQQMGAEQFGGSPVDAESHRQRRILAILVDVVVHPQFVAGQRGLVVPAVRQHPVALVGQAFVPQLFERPDHRLHEADVQGFVVVVEIHPAGLAGDVVAPLAGVLQHRRTAGIVEFLDAHLLDLGLVGDSELALDFEFSG